MEVFVIFLKLTSNGLTCICMKLPALEQLYDCDLFYKFISISLDNIKNCYISVLYFALQRISLCSYCTTKVTSLKFKEQMVIFPSCILLYRKFLYALIVPLKLHHQSSKNIKRSDILWSILALKKILEKIVKVTIKENEQEIKNNA